MKYTYLKIRETKQKPQKAQQQQKVYFILEIIQNELALLDYGKCEDQK